MIADETRKTVSGRPLGAISTLVSLFLLLLVFFIVLFSISQVHQQRLDAVVTSIDDAFGRLPSTLGLLTRPMPNDIAAGPEGFARAAAGLFTELAPLADQAHTARAGVLLSIAIPPSELFRAGTSQLQPEAAAILDRLAVLLQRRQPDQHYRLTIRAAIGPADRETDLAEQRIAGLAAALFGKGCPADALAIGVETGADAALRLDFAVIGETEEAE